MPTPLDRFAGAAEEYCAWCEAQAGPAPTEARTAIRHLSKLYTLALDLGLPAEVDPDIDGQGADDETWKAVFKRCSALPFSYYWEVHDPLKEPAEDPVCGDLADDLADIYRDLTCGLSLYRTGRTAEAEWEWRFSFQMHWGAHASSALRALHTWFENTGEW